jgi:signal peptidase II
MNLKPKNSGLFGGAIILAFIVLSLDQLHKYFMLEIMNIDEIRIFEVLSFFNLVMVWNHGVSFGMFAGHGMSQPMILIVITSLIVCVLFFWLLKEQQRIPANALALVIGGAIGNIIDRIRFGAVADFFDFHYMGWHYPAFNIADAAIFIGVVILMIHSIFLTKPTTKP